MANKINYSNVNFIKSALSKKDFLFDKVNILFIGKSNVGKSSLINSLVNRKSFMRVSQTPGRTRMLNYSLVDNKFYIVDCPGYGYFKKPADFEKMMLDYFESENNCKMVYLLIDSRRLISNEDLDMINILQEYKLPVTICFTKYDKLNQKEKGLLAKERNKYTNLFFINTSAENKYNIDLLRQSIEKFI